MSETIPYSDEELLRRAVLYPTNPNQSDLPRWAVVRNVFGVGAGYGHALCRRFGANPDDVIEGQQDEEEREQEEQEEAEEHEKDSVTTEAPTRA